MDNTDDDDLKEKEIELMKNDFAKQDKKKNKFRGISMRGDADESKKVD